MLIRKIGVNAMKPIKKQISKDLTFFYYEELGTMTLKSEDKEIELSEDNYPYELRSLNRVFTIEQVSKVRNLIETYSQV